MNNVATVAPARFAVRSDQFGYPMWSADVPDSPEVEITDQPHEMGAFGNLIAAQCMASALTRMSGYPWSVVTCVN